MTADSSCLLLHVLLLLLLAISSASPAHKIASVLCTHHDKATGKLGWYSSEEHCACLIQCVLVWMLTLIGGNKAAQCESRTACRGRFQPPL